MTTEICPCLQSPVFGVLWKWHVFATFGIFFNPDYVLVYPYNPQPKNRPSLSLLRVWSQRKSGRYCHSLSSRVPGFADISGIRNSVVHSKTGNWSVVDSTARNPDLIHINFHAEATLSNMTEIFFTTSTSSMGFWKLISEPYHEAVLILNYFLYCSPEVHKSPKLYPFHEWCKEWRKLARQFADHIELWNHHWMDTTQSVKNGQACL